MLLFLLPMGEGKGTFYRVVHQDLNGESALCSLAIKIWVHFTLTCMCTPFLLRIPSLKELEVILTL